VNCIIPNTVDGLEALVGGLCGRGPGTVCISKVSALVEVKVLIHEQKNLRAISDPLSEGPI
jgi:hypothetical protein